MLLRLLPALAPAAAIEMGCRSDGLSISSPMRFTETTLLLKPPVGEARRYTREPSGPSATRWAVGRPEAAVTEGFALLWSTEAETVGASLTD